jgi:hypothetical protein
MGVVRSNQRMQQLNLTTSSLALPLQGGGHLAAMEIDYDDFRTRRYHSHNNRTCFAV